MNKKSKRQGQGKHNMNNNNYFVTEIECLTINTNFGRCEHLEGLKIRCVQHTLPHLPQQQQKMNQFENVLMEDEQITFSGKKNCENYYD